MAAIPDRRKLFTKKDSVAEFATDMDVNLLRDMKQLFQSMDADADGELDVGELTRVFGALNVQAKNDEIAALFKELDKNNDKKISFKEFIEGLRWLKKSAVFAGVRRKPSVTVIRPEQSQQRAAPSPPAGAPAKRGMQRTASIANFVNSLDDSKIKQIRELFNMADQDGDGVITKPELAQLTKELGMDMPKKDLDALFANLDIDGDGTIKFEEFLSGMRWLNKGMSMAAAAAKASAIQQPAAADDDDDDDDEEVEELREKNKILLNYLKDLIGKGLESAKTHLKSSDIAPAEAVLNVLDLDFLIELEDVVGEVVDKKAVALHAKMRQYIKDNK